MSSTSENYGVFYLPNGDKFVRSKGNSGALIKKDGKVYEGEEFSNGKLNGWGAKRVPNPEDAQTFVNEYVGTFKRGCRDGEGQKYYANGVYDGNWKHNKRCGQGIMWFNDGALYLGEWRDDKFHGHGVLVQVNGNRFEGSFVDGKKNGEGIFYHKSTGQVQKGVWVDDVCQCSVMQDYEIRSQLAVQPTPYPIPELKLHNPEFVVSETFQHILKAAKKI